MSSQEKEKFGICHYRLKQRSTVKRKTHRATEIRQVGLQGYHVVTDRLGRSPQSGDESL